MHIKVTWQYAYSFQNISNSGSLFFAECWLWDVYKMNEILWRNRYSITQMTVLAVGCLWNIRSYQFLSSDLHVDHYKSDRWLQIIIITEKQPLFNSKTNVLVTKRSLSNSTNSVSFSLSRSWTVNDHEGLFLQHKSGSFPSCRMSVIVNQLM